VTPDEALARQIEIYRSMTGEQRLKIALDLHEFACTCRGPGFAASIRMQMTRRWNVI
jgi:hypothetical protein